MIDLSVVIVSCNSELRIKNCLDSFFKQEMDSVEVILVDNGSSDSTRQMLREYPSKVNLVLNKRNMGFGSAINQGVRLAKGAFILILNDDIILGKSFLYKLKQIVPKLPEYVGMISPKILKSDGKTIDSTGLILTMQRRFYDRGSKQLDKGQYDLMPNIFGPCAAASVYRKKMLECLKIQREYFDEDFFLILEDVDIAWRANNYGWKGVFSPELVCYHYGGISRKRSSLAQYYSFRNRYLLLLKNEKVSNLWRLFLLALVYDIPRLVFIALFNKYALLIVRDLFILTPKMLYKRKINLINIKLENCRCLAKRSHNHA